MKKAEGVAVTGNKKTKGAKRAISITVTVILAATFIFALVCFGIVVVGAMRGETANLFGYRIFYVLTDSMSPTIEPGETILSKEIKNPSEADSADKQIDVGDVITFSIVRNGQSAVNTHRVIKDVYFDEEFDCYCVVTKGDNPSATTDAPVPIKDVQAKMVCKIPALADVYRFFSSGSGIACIMLVPMGMMLLSLIYQIILKARKPAGKNDEPETDAEEREKAEKEIAENAVKEYIETEKAKRALAEQAVRDYIENQKKNKDN